VKRFDDHRSFLVNLCELVHLGHVYVFDWVEFDNEAPAFVQ